ncbi:MAG: hypothetical protein N2557_08500, partial [Hydrogenophilus sp.]|nr:hypothetical protein [Hydrogenophilus sp.]
VERSGLSPEIYSPKGELLHVELGAVRFALQIPRRVCILEDINTLDRLRIRLDDLTVEADSDIVLDTKDEGWEVPSWKLSIRRDAQKPNRLHLELARPKLHAQLVWLSPLPSPSQR